MECFGSLTQFQKRGIIPQLAELPFLFKKLRLFWWAKKSVQWPKVNGIVLKRIYFRIPRSLDFLYTYEINGITYKGDKPFFYNSYKTLNVKKVSDLMDKCTDGKQVDVYYNSSIPNISTLEPGRKDGAMGAMALLTTLFLLGAISFYQPSLIVEIIDYISNL